MDDKTSPLDELAVMNELISQAKDLKVERLPNGDISVSGTLVASVESTHPSYLIRTEL
jgi:hypothetical protein